MIARARGRARPTCCRSASRSCRSPSATTSTSTRRSSTRRTSGGCSGPTPTRCCPTGARCRSATTAAPARSSSPARRSRARTGCGRRYGPTEELDFELELGLRHRARQAARPPIAAADVREHVFGFVLVNDWSARDIQRFEYRPLGPFLGKSFATSISAWITPLAALEPYLVPGARAGPRAGGLPARSRATGRSTSRSRSSSTARSITPRQRARALLDVPAAARARDRQRRRRAPGRPVRLGHDLGLRARAPRARCSSSARPFLADGDTVALRGRAGAVALGEVRGTIVSAP